MKKFLVSLIIWAIALAPLSSYGATYVFADCATGFEVGCVAGADGAAGTLAAPWQTLSKFVATLATAAIGDRFILCKGTAWTNWNVQTFPAFVPTGYDNVVIDWADISTGGACSTFAGTAKPLLHTRTKKADNVTDCLQNDSRECSAFEFSQVSGSPPSRGGITIRNLAIDGAGAPATIGVLAKGVMQYIKAENLTITNVYMAGGCQSSSSWNPTRNIQFRGLSINGTVDMGLTSFNGCDTLVYESNAIDNACTASQSAGAKALCHPMYISGCDWGAGAGTCVSTQVTIRKNTITNRCKNINDIGDTTKEGCAAIVGHDRSADWTIEGNYIYTPSGKSYGSNYGIQMSPGNSADPECTRRLKIRGNTIVNPGNNGIEIGSAQDSEIATNVIVREDAWDSFEAIHQNEGVLADGDCANARNAFVNNSIYLNGAFGPTKAIRVSSSGTGHIVVGNLIKFVGGSGGNRNCFDTDLLASAFATWNNNLCFGHDNWATGFASKTSFTSGFGGFDNNGVSADPLLVANPALVNGFSMDLQSSSPAKNAGLAVRAINRLSISGAVRSGINIGAW